MGIRSSIIFEFGKGVSILYGICISRYKKYIICQVAFIKFSDVVPSFICGNAIGNLWNVRC